MSETDLVGPEPRKKRLTGRDGRLLRRTRQVFYTDVEWQQVSDAARLRGKPVRRFIRDLSLGVVSRPQQVLGNPELIHELGRSGTALVDLATIAKASGALPETTTLEAALNELLTTVRRIVPLAPQ